MLVSSSFNISIIEFESRYVGGVGSGISQSPPGSFFFLTCPNFSTVQDGWQKGWKGLQKDQDKGSFPLTESWLAVPCGLHSSTLKIYMTTEAVQEAS